MEHPMQPPRQDCCWCWYQERSSGSSARCCTASRRPNENRSMVAHHALRHAAIDMPDVVRVNDPRGDGTSEAHAMVSISPRWGGLPVEQAWESIARGSGHLDLWNTSACAWRVSLTPLHNFVCELHNIACNSIAEPVQRSVLVLVPVHTTCYQLVAALGVL